MPKLYLSIYDTHDSSCTRDVLDSFDLKKNVKNLKELLAVRHKQIGKNLNVVYHGEVLDDETKLEDSGIHSESVLHCFTKSEFKCLPVSKLNLVELQELLVSLRTAVANPAFKTVVKKLDTFDGTNEFIMQNPAIAENPIAIAYMRDTKLLRSFQSPDILAKVVEEVPAFGKALEIFCKLVSKETVICCNEVDSTSYSLDALSDDEMEAEPVDISSRNSAQLQPITPTQLAAALANVTGSLSSTARSGNSQNLGSPNVTSTAAPARSTGSRASPAPSAGSSSSAGPITAEMFSQALQNALAASVSREGSTAPPQSAPETRTEVEIPNMAESLQLMREMGIADETLGTQALRATNGDVQAAVNLIFAQWMAD